MVNIDKEIEKIVEQKMKAIDNGDANQVEILWQYMNEINERVQCLEKQKEDKKMTFIDEKMIDEYLSEGYDRERDDNADEDINETLMTCSMCENAFELEEMDFVDGEWLCWNCEKNKEGIK